MTILACDLGGTLMKIGVVRDGRVLAQTSEASNSGAGLAPGLPRLKTAWLRLLSELKLTPRDCAGISVAFPSLVNTKSGRILAEYGKYADAANCDLRRWAKQELELPLALENDARMALVGEWRFGAGRGSDNVVMMTLGTGLGTAAVMEGQLLRGAHGQAGVLGGHATVRLNGRQCYCGNVGCAEAEASTAVLSEVAAALPEWGGSTLRNLPRLDYAGVFAHAAAGDGCALKLREYSLAIWGTLAVSLIHAYDPDTMILGGGIMASAEVVLPAVSEHVRRHAHTPWGKVRVLTSQLGDRGALLAGEWLLREQFPNLQ
jgi:glucokinase